MVRALENGFGPGVEESATARALVAHVPGVPVVFVDSDAVSVAAVGAVQTTRMD